MFPESPSAHDILFAGQALGRQLRVAAANLKEFSRIKGLGCEDQAKASSQLTLGKAMYSYFDLNQNKALKNHIVARCIQPGDSSLRSE